MKDAHGTVWGLVQELNEMLHTPQRLSLCEYSTSGVSWSKINAHTLYASILYPISLTVLAKFKVPKFSVGFSFLVLIIGRIFYLYLFRNKQLLCYLIIARKPGNTNWSFLTYLLYVMYDGNIPYKITYETVKSGRRTGALSSGRLGQWFESQVW